MSKETIEIYIDKEKFTIDNEKQTAAELLKLAKEDPAETTLVLKLGNDLVKFKDDDDVYPQKWNAIRSLSRWTDACFVLRSRPVYRGIGDTGIPAKTDCCFRQ